VLGSVSAGHTRRCSCALSNNVNESDLLHVISERRRQDILHLVWEEEMSAGMIADSMRDITFGAVSQHLAVLRQAGVVTVRREGRYRWYKANRETLGPLAEYLSDMWVGQLRRLKTLAEEAERLNGGKKRR
jgi:DNA-binding transcriptional ArsR family regulator